MNPTQSYTDGLQEWTSPWTDKSCCCCKIAFFPDGNFTICGHWRRRLDVPIIVGICFALTFSSLIYDTLNVFPNLISRLISWSVVSLFALFVIISYLSVIIRGPGYAPYDWDKNKDKQFSWNELMDHIVIFREQEAYARTATRPLRSSFSKNARRFVLRADHLCVWCQSWIGILNHRYFLLMTGYVPLYSLSYLLCRIWWVRWLVDGNFEWWAVIGAVSTFVTTVPGLISLYYFSQGVRNVANGVTGVELFYNRIPQTRSLSCLKNCEEICGSRKWICCWCFPFCCCFEPLEDGFYTAASILDRSFQATDEHQSNPQFGTL
jgi:hypothetical protein